MTMADTVSPLSIKRETLPNMRIFERTDQVLVRLGITSPRRVTSRSKPSSVQTLELRHHGGNSRGRSAAESKPERFDQRNFHETFAVRRFSMDLTMAGVLHRRKMGL